MSTLKIKEIITYNDKDLLINGKELHKGNNVVKDDDYTASHMDIVWCDTVTNGEWTLTLPDSPNDYDWVEIIDYKANFDDNNLTVDRNGSTINGKDENLVVDDENTNIVLRCINGDWRIIE
jgi:hypothetical protein